ncbi:uncharacterized protein EV420DRAFT_1638471 [Desarmillaria tabescens]|uniref:Uncharacterized protein n=1 Tax=Armillaria tabescens TaxID=1929756 RepID=A0AA39NDM1_ARMTA|nr:uncharacterized protein EV420DRAFT_1638471 [Desarmillaria tabescens]KAK0463538.1 hypothetical protein EV420DRAFT_1638471 [Desarmillaria tabescens]
MHRFSTAKEAESRLLDPSYFSTACRHQPHIYIDDQGNMHDPDYRPFPVIPSAHILSSSLNSSLLSRDEQPGWVSSHSAVRDSEEDDQRDYFNPFVVHARRCSSLTRNSIPYYPSSVLDLPVNDIEEERECDNLKDVVDSCKWLHTSLDSKVEDYLETPQVDQSEPKEDTVEEQPGIKRPTLTCSEGMKNKWYAISLSISFRAFRARRGLKSVFSV